MSVRQISVFLENKPGTLEGMTKLLADNKIDLRALSLAEAEGFGIVRIIVNDVYETMTVLQDNDVICRITPVLGVAVPDVPGGLDRVLQLLKAENINIAYMYSTQSSKKTGNAYMIFKVTDVTAAEEALRRDGISFLEEGDTAEI